MTVDRLPMERHEHFVGDRRLLISSVKESLQTEMYCDCVIITKEGIAVPVHRMMLTPSPLLQTLLLSTSCCRGLCSHTSTSTIMLPDVSYPQLNILLGFFYSGLVKCYPSEIDSIKDLLVNTFRVPKSTVMLHAKQGHTDCVECGEHLPVNSLLEHLVSVHVEEPCVRDMTRVEGGDSRAVTCSQHAGNKTCDIDNEKTRISNGIYNYVGQEDPMSCVLDHYRIHFKNMVQFVRKEHSSFTIPSHVNLMFDEVKLRQLARTASSQVLEPSTWTTRADVDNFLQSKSMASNSTRPVQPLPSPPPSATPPTSHSGGLSSPDDEPETKNAARGKQNWLQSNSEKIKTKRKKSSLSSDSDSDTFSDPPGSADIRSDSMKSSKYFPASKRPRHNSGVGSSSAPVIGVGRESNIQSMKPIGTSSSVNKHLTNNHNTHSSSVESVSVGGKKRQLSGEGSRNTASNTTSNIVLSNCHPPAGKPVRSSGEGRTRKCRVCKKVQTEAQFPRHVTSHLYQLWEEVNRGEGSQLCREGCGQQLNTWKNHVLHLATHHEGLKHKLAVRDETLSDYELDQEEVEVANLGKEVGGLAVLISCSEREVLARHQLPPDYLREEKTTPEDQNSSEVLNNSQNPLLDNSQEDALVIMENGEEDTNVDELLDDSKDDPDVISNLPVPVVLPTSEFTSPIVIDTSQSDSDIVLKPSGIGLDSLKIKDDGSDSDATAPWDGEEGDRMKEVEEED